MEEKLAIADEMARLLHSKHTDPNEVTACVTFLRDEDQAPHFFDYLDAVIADGRSVVRSGRTLRYYRGIRDVSQQHLKCYREDPKAMAWILGWTTRLLRYYQAGGKPLQRIKLPQQVEKTSQATKLEMGGTYTGTVKFFNSGKKYGFIIPDIGEGDVYVNASQVRGGRTLTKGDRVRFTLGEGRKGSQAKDVQPE
jgi:cold shock CspA family protein